MALSDTMTAMILPRYSIRTLLIATLVCAFVSLVVRQAVLTRPWAIGVTVAIGTAVALLLSHMFLFALAQMLTTIRKSSRKPEAGGSPFASAGLPRQVVAPIDPD